MDAIECPLCNVESKREGEKNGGREERERQRETRQAANQRTSQPASQPASQTDRQTQRERAGESACIAFAWNQYHPPPSSSPLWTLIHDKVSRVRERERLVFIGTCSVAVISGEKLGQASGSLPVGCWWFIEQRVLRPLAGGEIFNIFKFKFSAEKFSSGLAAHV
jgi:hypothetical protein